MALIGSEARLCDLLVLLFCVGCVSTEDGASISTSVTDDGMQIDEYFVPEECAWAYDGDRDQKGTNDKEAYRVKVGDAVEMYYTIRVQGSMELLTEASREKIHPPITFVVGDGEVVKGWEEGVKGMCSGSKRKLTIPPKLGFGDAELEGIPKGSILEVDMELATILQGDGKKSSVHEETMKLIFQAIDKNHNGVLSKVGLTEFCQVVFCTPSFFQQANVKYRRTLMVVCLLFIRRRSCYST
jgi:hypothetical protein